MSIVTYERRGNMGNLKKDSYLSTNNILHD